MSHKYMSGLDGGGIGAVAVHPSRRFLAVAEKCRHRSPNVYVYSYPQLGLVKVMRNGTERAYSSLSFNDKGDTLARWGGAQREEARFEMALVICPSSHGGLCGFDVKSATEHPFPHPANVPPPGSLPSVLARSVGGYPDYLLTLWNWEEEDIVLRSKAFSQDVFTVKFSPYFDGFINTCGTGHIRFWKMATTFTGLKLQGQLGKFGNVELSDIMGFVELPDGKVRVEVLVCLPSVCLRWWLLTHVEASTPLFLSSGRDTARFTPCFHTSNLRS